MSEKATGFIQNMTPPKKTQTDSVYFRFDIQDSPTTRTRVLGFGERSYSTVEEFAVSKSPVKIRLTRNERYNSLIFNERSNCHLASTVDVPFSYVEMEQSSEHAQPSMFITVIEIKNSIPDNSKFFTVHGQVFVGQGEVKVYNNRKLKEDIKIADPTGHISIHIWEPILDNIQHTCIYELTRNRLRKYMGELYLTTTPATKWKLIEECSNIVEPDYDTSLTITFTVKTLEEIGDVQVFHSCNKCFKMISNVVGTKMSVRCDHCKKQNV